MMAIFLWRSSIGIENRERLYSLAGLVAKLGLLFSEYSAHARSSDWAIAIATIEGAFFLVLTIAALKIQD